MELKLFAAKRESGYSGGLIVVAANTIEEAYTVYTEWATKHHLSWIFEKYIDVNGEVIDINDVYPFYNWYEIPQIEVICDTPKVIDEGGYTE